MDTTPNINSAKATLNPVTAEAPNVSALPRSITTAATVLTFTLICTLLYVGRTIAIPLALAVLLSFMLNPIAKRLQRLHIPRSIAATVTVILFCAFAGALGWIIGGQIGALSQEIPGYQSNIIKRVTEVRSAFRGGTIEKLQSTLDNVESEIDAKEKDEAKAKQNQTGLGAREQKSKEPVPVVITSSGSLLDFSSFGTLLPVLEPLSVAGLVILLSILMMIRWDDLRSRLLSFTGQRNVTVATRALEDSGRKITRYLVVQALYNGGVGLAVGIGLYFIGVPYAALWGLCAGLFRYVPYVGPLIAAALPLLHTLVASPGWTQVLLVLGFFLVLELLSNNVIEPWIYGSQLGMSEIGVVMAAVVWTFLWGPVGLVLATPLTVCLVVLGEYLPCLSFLSRLMGDKPVLELHFRYYQRLLAHDEIESENLAREQIKAQGLLGFLSSTVVPALAVARNEERHDLIPSDEAANICTVVLKQIERSEEKSTDLSLATAWKEKAKFMIIPDSKLAMATARLLEISLANTGCEVKIFSSKQLAGEVSHELAQENFAGCCLLSLDQGTLAKVKHVLHRISAGSPQLPLFLGLLARPKDRPLPASITSWAGNATVCRTFLELHDSLTALGSHTATVQVAPEIPVEMALTPNPA